MTAAPGAAPKGAAGRVAAVHAQTRRTLALAAAFALAAPLAALVPNRAGAWLPLHLFLAGALLLAISGATQMLAVTWSAAPPPGAGIAAFQRWLLAGGAAGIGATRALGAPPALTAAAGTAVLAALAILAGILVSIRRGAVVKRFDAAIDSYLVALAAGITGTVGGLVMAATRPAGEAADAGLRSAHLTVNLFGLAGVVVAATLPHFVATQARVKTSPRATPRAVRTVTATMAVAAATAAAGQLFAMAALAAAGFFLYAAAVGVLLTLLPPIGRRQLDWAGPRLLQLAAGVAWWGGGAALLATAAILSWDQGPIIVAVVVGGFAQILAASLAYLAPVLRGGGHQRLAAGFATTRSAVALVAANAAATGALLQLKPVLALGLAVWVGDATVRGARLVLAP